MSYIYPKVVYTDLLNLIDDLIEAYENFYAVGNYHGERNRYTPEYRAWKAATDAFDAYIQHWFPNWENRAGEKLWQQINDAYDYCAKL